MGRKDSFTFFKLIIFQNSIVRIVCFHNYMNHTQKNNKDENEQTKERTNR